MTKAYRSIPVRESLQGLSAERQARIKAQAADIIADEMALRDLRKLRQVTQEDVANRLGGKQVYISRLEKRTDMKLSTLKNYVEALGGELQLVVTFPDGIEVQLSELGVQNRRLG